MKALSDEEMANLMSAGAAGAQAAEPEGFMTDEQMADLVGPEERSQGESAFRGLAQGSSFGFGDELSGAAGWAAGKLGIVPEMGYDYYRDYARKEDKAAEAANPKSYMGGQLGGAVLTAAMPGMNAIGAGKLPGWGAATAQGSVQGGLMGAGASEASSVGGVLADTGIGTAAGGVGGFLGYGVGKGIEKGTQVVGDAAKRVGDYFKGGAEKLAEKATGATGAQSAKFADDAGRELLDQGVVRFGDTPEKIAGRAADLQGQSGQAIGNALEELDKRGITASVDNVVGVIQSQIDELTPIPGNEKLIRQLQSELDDLINRGQSTLPISRGEIAKRNYQNQTNYASPEAEKKATGRVASAFRQEVEDAATAADPGIADKFIEDKRLYKLLEPVKEAAQKRANQLNQSPFMGFGDMAAGAMGGFGGSGEGAGGFGGGAIAGIAGRRFLAPRASSMLAVGADRIGDIIKKMPQALGKFAPAMQSAAQRGIQAVAATHFILQQTQPEYQQLLKDLEDAE